MATADSATEELSKLFRAVGLEERRVTDTLKNKALSESLSGLIHAVFLPFYFIFLLYKKNQLKKTHIKKTHKIKQSKTENGMLGARRRGE